MECQSAVAFAAAATELSLPLTIFAMLLGLALMMKAGRE
jgi:hypothetical protein